MRGELLEGEGIRKGGPDSEHADVTQEVEPAEAGGDRDHGEQTRGDGPRRPSRLALRIAVGLACAGWLCAGVYGIVAYGHNYYRYRGFAPPRDPPGVSQGRLVKERFWSAAMHQQRSYLIYLPPGYAAAAASGHRFSVLYLLHGSPGGGDLFINAAGVGTALDRLVTERRVKPFLIVMPNGGDGTFTSDTEWADTPHGRYESLALDTVRAVDARWPTRADRRHRGLGGDSEGAYGAVNIGLRHLGMFSVAESWSGYFTQTGQQGPFAGTSQALVDANSPSIYVRAMRTRLHRLPFHAYIFSGHHERIVPMIGAFARELHHYGGDVTYAFPRGGHNWRLWRDQAPRMMLYAGKLFAAAR